MREKSELGSQERERERERERGGGGGGKSDLKSDLTLALIRCVHVYQPCEKPESYN